VLQVQIYESHSDLKIMKSKLRVNREINLTQLGINKTLVSKIKNENRPTSLQPTTSVDEYLSKDYFDTFVKIIQMIRTYK
jgi:hypothetical protein